MEVIREVIISVVTLALVFSAVDLMLPEGSIRGYARFVCGLILMLLLLRPLSLLLSWEPGAATLAADEQARQAEALAMDAKLLRSQAQQVAQAFGAQAQANVILGVQGGIERIELTVFQGDAQLARDGVRAAFGLSEENVIILN